MAYALKEAADRTLNERAAVLQMKINAGAVDARDEFLTVQDELSRRAVKTLRSDLRAAAAEASAELTALLALVSDRHPVPAYCFN